MKSGDICPLGVQLRREQTLELHRNVPAERSTCRFVRDFGVGVFVHDETDGGSHARAKERFLTSGTTSRDGRFNLYRFDRARALLEPRAERAKPAYASDRGGSSRAPGRRLSTGKIGPVRMVARTGFR